MDLKRIGPRKFESPNYTVIELDNGLTDRWLEEEKYLPERDSRGWLVKLRNIPIEKVIEQIIKDGGPILLKSQDHHLFWDAIEKLSITSDNTG